MATQQAPRQGAHKGDRRLALWVGGTGIFALTVCAALTGRLLVWPPSDPPRQADAVIVLAGGRGERLAEGLRLMESRLAGTLVVSYGGDPASPDAAIACQSTFPFEVVCLKPSLGTTRGEARAISDLARGRHWGSLVLVTSAYHVTRSALLLGRCFHGTVQAVAAYPRGGVALAVYAHEWAGLIAAWSVERSC